MRMFTRRDRFALAGLALITTLGLAGAALADQPASLDAALKLAAEQDKVLVLDFYTDW